jgi:hypothetical protein
MYYSIFYSGVATAELLPLIQASRGTNFVSVVVKENYSYQKVATAMRLTSTERV